VRYWAVLDSTGQSDQLRVAGRPDRATGDAEAGAADLVPVGIAVDAEVRGGGETGEAVGLQIRGCRFGSGPDLRSFQLLMSA